MYCDDSRVTPADAKEVVVSFVRSSPHLISRHADQHSLQGKPAYVLFYKRIQP